MGHHDVLRKDRFSGEIRTVAGRGVARCPACRQARLFIALPEGAG